MFFFARANHPLKTCVKTYINHFHGNHFWTSSKSFSCAVNHFQTSRKWFLTHVNDFFPAKNSKKCLFCSGKSLTKIYFQMEIIFLAQEMIISKTYEIIFVALLEMISGKLEMVCTECWSYCSWKWFLHTSKMISWLRWECHNENRAQMMFFATTFSLQKFAHFAA